MKRLILGVIAAYVIYILLCMLVVPLLQERTGLEEELSYQASGAADSANERILCINDNTDALVWRLRMIEAAQEEISLTTFDFGNDRSGTEMMAALLNAAERGVRVRILVDGIYGTLNLYSDRFDVLAAHENIELRLYNPVNFLQVWQNNYRLHDKVLLVDDWLYMLGGRNTTDLFLGDYNKDANTDRDVLVWRDASGVRASFDQVRQYFEQLWALDCNKTLNCDSPKETVKARLSECYLELQTTYPEGFAPTDWVGQTMPVNAVTLICNPVASAKKEPVLWKTLCARMAAGEDVIVQTPYVICNREMYQDLTQITRSGTNVTVITNAVANGANPWGCTDYLNSRDKILNTGVTICEYNGEQSLHTKTVLIDDSISVIGSFNMDMRSTYLDTETMLVIDCPALNAQLRGEAAQQMDMSKQVAPDGTETLGQSCVELSFGLPKAIVYGVLRVLIRPIRHIL